MGVILRKNNFNYFFRAAVHHPQRLQTVLELYSQDLKGLVLFIDTNNLDFYSGLAKGNFSMRFLKLLNLFNVHIIDIFLL